MQTVAFGSAILLILIVFSRAVEYPILQSLSLAIVAFAAGLVFLPFSGGLGAMFRDRLAHGVLWLTVLMLLSVPFSIFRGGSLGVLQLYWSRSVILFLVVAACASTFAQFRKLLIAFSVAIAAISVYSLLQGSETQGRIGMDSGFFSNPNDLAAILMMALPIFAGASRLLRSVMLKSLLMGSTVFLWATFLRTGSRGGFIAMTVVLPLLFWHAPLFRKAQMLLAGIVLVGFALIYLPSSTLKRFVVFSDSVRLAEFKEGEVDAYTGGSSESRMEMASQGVMFTLQHPIVGLGAGNFRVASTDYFRSRGVLAPWTDVHNTYLQISSENGIPALLLYVTLLVAAVRRLSRFHRLYRNSTYIENQWVAEAAWYLRLAILSYMVSATFGNYAYQYHLPLLIALTICLTTAEANRPDAVRAPELIPGRAVQRRVVAPSGSRTAPMKPIVHPSLPSA